MQVMQADHTISQSTIALIMKLIKKSYKEEEQQHEPLLDVNRDEYNESQAIYSNLTTTYRVEFEHLAFQ